MSTNSRFLNKRTDKWDTITEWHNVVMWGARGESLANILAKGSYLVVEGELRTRSWEDRDGNKRYQTEVVAKDVETTGRAPGAQQSGDYEENQDPRKARQQQRPQRQQSQPRRAASFVPQEDDYDDQDPQTGFG